jgi:hypothetical protein
MMGRGMKSKAFRVWSKRKEFVSIARECPHKTVDRMYPMLTMQQVYER